MSNAIRLPDPMTVEEFQTWQPEPEQAGWRWQLIDGHPVGMAPTSIDHGAIQSRCSTIIDMRPAIAAQHQFSLVKDMDANDGEPQPLDPDLDWTAFPLVEHVPNRCGGAPVLRGTRLPVKSILDNYDDGCTPGQVAAMFEVALADVQTVLAHRG